MSEDGLRRGKLTQEHIVQAAYDLFIKQGYHGTSMRQIAGQAGIALGSLYNHFDSKEAVFNAVFLQHHPYHRVWPAISGAQGDTVEEIVQDAASQMVEALKESPEFLNLMFIEVVEFKSKHTHQLFAEIFPQGLQLVQQLLGSQESRLRPIPPMMLIRSFLGLFFSYYATEVIFTDSLPAEFQQNAMDYLVDIYLHGILERHSVAGLGDEQ